MASTSFLRAWLFGAAHCGFDVTLYDGDYEKAHAELCREFDWNVSAKILLFVGRLEGAEFTHNGRRMTHKNPAFALEIAKECIRRDDQIKLLMIGSGEEKRKEFEAQVRGWGVSENVRFAGTRSDVPHLMSGSDLLLFPSLAEGLGMVVVEAQAAGLSVLASDTTPRESVVASQLVHFMSLDLGPVTWSAQALQIMKAGRQSKQQTHEKVKQSAFSIENSAKQLIALYVSAHHPQEVV